MLVMGHSISLSKKALTVRSLFFIRVVHIHSDDVEEVAFSDEHMQFGDRAKVGQAIPSIYVREAGFSSFNKVVALPGVSTAHRKLLVARLREWGQRGGEFPPQT